MTELTVPNGTVQNWIADKINASRRAARPQPCPRCNTPTLVGPDHDTVAAVARVDLQPVTPLEEVAALLTGRRSYDLIRGNLHHREPEHVHARRNHDAIHLSHACLGHPEGALF